MDRENFAKEIILEAEKGSLVVKEGVLEKLQKLLASEFGDEEFNHASISQIADNLIDIQLEKVEKDEN